MHGHRIKHDGVVQVWKLSWPFSAVPWLFEFELALETCMVMVFNTTELLRYEKAHSLCLLVSTAARFYTRSIAWPLVCIYLNDKHVHCYSSLSFKAQMKWPTILKVVALPNFEYFWSHYKVGYFLRVTLFFVTNYVVPNLLIIKLWHCPLGGYKFKKCLLWKQSKSTFFCLESRKD